MAKEELKEVLTKLETIIVDTAVIKNDIKHIKYKLSCLEEDNKTQNDKIKSLEDKTSKMNIEITKIALIITIIVSAIVFFVKEVVL